MICEREGCGTVFCWDDADQLFTGGTFYAKSPPSPLYHEDRGAASFNRTINQEQDAGRSARTRAEGIISGLVCTVENRDSVPLPR